MEELTHQVPQAGAIAPAHQFAKVEEVSVEYDQKSNGIIVTPKFVRKGANVRFKNPKGAKLRIVFLSPKGNETDTMLDSDACALTVGGCYHFKCFFTLRERQVRSARKPVGSLMFVHTCLRLLVRQLDPTSCMAETD